MSYLYTETEEEIQHGDDPEQEVKYEEMLVANGVLERTSEEQAALDAKLSVKKQTSMVMILCSCGSPKCYAIRYFGLPKPTFHEAIEPIGSQMVRDDTARRMKMCGN